MCSVNKKQTCLVHDLCLCPCLHMKNPLSSRTMKIFFSAALALAQQKQLGGSSVLKISQKKGNFKQARRNNFVVEHCT